jgi:hypothetical protein
MTHATILNIAKIKVKNDMTVMVSNLRQDLDTKDQYLEKEWKVVPKRKTKKQ